MPQYTERAQRALAEAKQAALKKNHDSISTEHLLCGLLMDSSSLAHLALSDAGVTLGRVAEEIAAGPPMTVRGNLPYSPRVEQALKAALNASRSMGCLAVGTEHILLGLLKEDSGYALKILEKLDVHPNRLREDIMTLLGKTHESVKAELRHIIAHHGIDNVFDAALELFREAKK